jgi:two-component sensor histidine kinase
MSGPASEARAQRHKRWDRLSEVLVQEAYHRIANHLQLIVSLIGMRAREHPDPAVREELLDVRSRILAVARLHSELQRAQDDQELEVSHFLARVAEDLRTSLVADTHAGSRISFDIDPAEMSSDKAMTLALIINELVTNAFKHASAPGRSQVTVGLSRQLGGPWRLLVSDDGPGLPASAFMIPHGRGLDLIRVLVRKLQGNITVEPSMRGAAISVVFP